MEIGTFYNNNDLGDKMDSGQGSFSGEEYGNVKALTGTQVKERLKNHKNKKSKKSEISTEKEFNFSGSDDHLNFLDNLRKDIKQGIFNTQDKIKETKVVEALSKAQNEAKKNTARLADKIGNTGVADTVKSTTNYFSYNSVNPNYEPKSKGGKWAAKNGPAIKTSIFIGANLIVPGSGVILAGLDKIGSAFLTVPRPSNTNPPELDNTNPPPSIDPPPTLFIDNSDPKNKFSKNQLRNTLILAGLITLGVAFISVKIIKSFKK